jgi:hypothetical protein
MFMKVGHSTSIRVVRRKWRQIGQFNLIGLIDIAGHSALGFIDGHFSGGDPSRDNLLLDIARDIRSSTLLDCNQMKVLLLNVLGPDEVDPLSSQ